MISVLVEKIWGFNFPGCLYARFFLLYNIYYDIIRSVDKLSWSTSISTAQDSVRELIF